MFLYLGLSGYLILFLSIQRIIFNKQYLVDGFSFCHKKLVQNSNCQVYDEFLLFGFWNVLYIFIWYNCL